MRILRISSVYDVIKNNKAHKSILNKIDTFVNDGYLTNNDGTLNIENLVIVVEYFVKLGYPILICCNYGTTFKGAYDNVEKINNLLMPIFKKNNFSNANIKNKEDEINKKNKFWIHIDGALGAAYMPFIEKAFEQGIIDS